MKTSLSICLALALAPSLAPLASARVLNISTRALSVPGDLPVIAGIVVDDPSGESEVLFRGIGQGLYKILDAKGAPVIPKSIPCMAAPRLEVHDASGAIVAVSSPMSQLSPLDQFQVLTTDLRIGAAPIVTADDAIIHANLPSGLYTVVMTDPSGTGGLALIEAYAVTSTSRFLNISTRGPTHPELPAGAMIVGFVVDSQMNMLVRAVGPALAKYGVPDPIPDPVFTLFTSAGNAVWVPPGLIQTPSGYVTAAAWGDNPLLALGAMLAASRTGAFPLDAGSKDAAISFILPAGAWTVVASHASVAATHGTMMVEAYDATIR